MELMNTLLSRFGYDDFRPLQKEAIQALLARQDVLLISPTGGGKSLVYQMAATMMDGVAIIVCPLLALMTQQVQRLRAAGIKAEFLNSTLNPGEQDDLVWALRHNQIDLLFLSPEKLSQFSVLGVLSHIDIAFFAIDEAHCITHWGNHFRPEYGTLSLIRENFSDTPIIAMSGTADKKTQTGIIDSLQLNQPQKFIHSFNRENIEFIISQKKMAKQQVLNFLINEVLGWSGIIYCRSRKRVEEMSHWLQSHGIDSLYFHANMEPADKRKNLARFSNENGLVMVATSAFGMGIDIDKTRFVIHMDLPSSIESYYQEVGRAGRDGRPAKSLLLYGLQDVLKLMQFNLEEQNDGHIVSSEDLQSLLQFLEHRGCRKKSLLQHFGEEIEDCHNCDRCLRQRSEQNVTMAAQKFLSLIHHTKGVLSFSVLIQILIGKNSKAVSDIEGHRLSLFAQGRELSEVSWKSLVRYLLAYEYISISQFTPFQIRLEHKAKSILRGEEQVIINADIHWSSDIQNIDLAKQAVRLKLLKWYHSFEYPELLSLNQLETIVRNKPQSLAAISRLTGLGMNVVEQIGLPILSLMKEENDI